MSRLIATDRRRDRMRMRPNLMALEDRQLLSTGQKKRPLGNGWTQISTPDRAEGREQVRRTRPTPAPRAVRAGIRSADFSINPKKRV